MTTINLDFKIKSFNSKEESQETAAEAVANLLAYSQDGNYAKRMRWAMSLVETKKVDIEPTDYDELRNFLENSKSIFAFAKVQIMEAINKSAPK